MRVLYQITEALRKQGDGPIWPVSDTPKGNEAGLCVYMNVILATNAIMEWEPQKDSVSEKGPQASAQLLLK